MSKLHVTMFACHHVCTSVWTWFASYLTFNYLPDVFLVQCKRLLSHMSVSTCLLLAGEGWEVGWLFAAKLLNFVNSYLHYDTMLGGVRNVVNHGDHRLLVQYNTAHSLLLVVHAFKEVTGMVILNCLSPYLRLVRHPHMKIGGETSPGLKIKMHPHTHQHNWHREYQQRQFLVCEGSQRTTHRYGRDPHPTQSSIGWFWMLTKQSYLALTWLQFPWWQSHQVTTTVMGLWLGQGAGLGCYSFQASNHN